MPRESVARAVTDDMVSPARKSRFNAKRITLVRWSSLRLNGELTRNGPPVNKVECNATARSVPGCVNSTGIVTGAGVGAGVGIGVGVGVGGGGVDVLDTTSKSATTKL